jgi:ATP-dependent DNA helicase Q1
METAVEVGGLSRVVDGSEEELMVLSGATVATGFGAVVVGFGAVVVGFGAVVVGFGAVVVGFGAVVVGFGAVLVGFGSSSSSSSSSPLPLEVFGEELVPEVDPVFGGGLEGLVLDFESFLIALLEEPLEEPLEELLLPEELPLFVEPLLLLLGELEFVVALSA